MLGMEIIQKIQEMYEHKKMSMDQIAQQLSYSRPTISKYLNGGDVGYHRQMEIPRPKAESIHPLIEKWIAEDENTPRKQRRSRQKIHRDLVEEYQIEVSYTTVKNVYREIKSKRREVFIPREHKPGEYCEFDFGEAYLKINGEAVKIYMHCFQLTYSNDIFIYVSTRATQEEMFESHKRAFDYYDGVPLKMRYDNLRLAVKKVLTGRKRDETNSFAKFREQYGYEAEFCALARGNEKGDVEGCVGYSRRNFLSPVPTLNSLENLEEFNQRFKAWCQTLRATRKVYGTEYQVGELYLIEKEIFLHLPTQNLEVGKHVTGKVNHNSLVPVDNAFYSVPTKYAYQIVDIVITSRQMIIFDKDQEIARHERTWKKGTSVFDPLHYLSLFRDKPYALINGKPIAQLPGCFKSFFEKSMTYGLGTVSDCLKILELLKTHKLKDVACAIELAESYDTYYADGVINLLNQLIQGEPVFRKLETLSNPKQNGKIETVDLNRYNTLIKKG